MGTTHYFFYRINKYTLILSMLVSLNSLASNKIKSTSDLNLTHPLNKIIGEKVTVQNPLCFGREYSVQHLNDFPKQTVKKISGKFWRHKEAPETLLYSVEVSLKGEKELYHKYLATFVPLDKDGEFGIECDGGSVTLQLDKSNHLVMINKGFVLSGSCGDEENEALKSLDPKKGGDDLFKMTLLPDEFCQYQEFN